MLLPMCGDHLRVRSRLRLELEFYIGHTAAAAKTNVESLSSNRLHFTFFFHKKANRTYQH